MLINTTYIFSANGTETDQVKILFAAAAHQYCPACLFSCLDGYEHYALLNSLVYKHKEKISFSKRMTLNYKDGKLDERCQVMPVEMQIRVIRDLVKYDMPVEDIQATKMLSRSVMHIMNNIPTKKWFKMRLERALLRILPASWGISKTLRQNYLRLERELLNHF